LGDDSALPAIERRLSELPAAAQVTVRLQKPQGHTTADRLRVLRSAAQLDAQWVDDLAAESAALQLPSGEGHIWAAGENSLMAEVRSSLVAKEGINLKRLHVAAYWKRGVADHHETLTQA
jgi:ferric-chelate reductase (NADPH)